MGLKGKLSLIKKDFLSDRTFKVRMGNTLSESFEQEMGVPQGSILSVTLFMIKINSIANHMKQGTDCSLFVDDFNICYRSRNMQSIERHLQHNINNLQKWAEENGFTFSLTKTVCVHFCQRRGFHDDHVLHLENTQIPVVEQTKFLGMIFDKRLSFLPHIKYLKKKCQK